MIFGIAQKSGNKQVENKNKKTAARNTLCLVPFSKSHSAADFSVSFTSGRHSVLYVLAPWKPKKIKTS